MAKQNKGNNADNEGGVWTNVKILKNHELEICIFSSFFKKPQLM